MLDSHARRFVEPLIGGLARAFKKVGVSADAVTVLGVLSGMAAALLVGSGHAWWGVAVLWLSGLLDATDGALARMTHSSPLGAILDITFDRVVEISMVVALAWRYPHVSLPLLVLAGVIAIAMSLFLSIGAAAQNTSHKAFHYAPGLGERSEAFIMFTLMVLDARHLVLWTWVFVAVIVFTMAQRLYHVRRLLAAVQKSDPAQAAKGQRLP